MLKIENLQVAVADKPVLNGLDLEVPTGEVHAIMGPNGSGKSTLAHVLAGRPGYEVTGGPVTLDGTRPAGARAGGARARRRVSRVPVPGGDPRRQQRVSAEGGVQCRAQAPRPARSRAFEFLALVREKMKLMHMDESFLVARRQRRLLRRREEAQRDSADADARAEARDTR